MKPIEDVKKDLLDWIGKGIDLALKALKNTIPADVPKYKDVIMLEGRYRELHKNWLEKGVLSDEEALVESNKIQEAIINFINDLKEEDLVKELAEKVEQKAKTGKVLYRVPDQMQVNKEVKCIIRVAFTEDILLQDIEQEADDTIKDVRIADVMAAEIIDPNEQPAFAIRTFSERVQFIDESDFTEWLFYVKPLLEGSYPLLLKVAIVEIVDGKERKREVVLEETIQVISTEPEEVKEEFAEAKDVQVAGFTQAKSKAAAGGGATGKRLGMVAMILVAFGAVYALYSIFSPNRINQPDIILPSPGGEKTESERWEEIRDLQDSFAIKQFLEDFPDGEFADEALEKLETLRFSVVFEQKGDSLLFSAKGGQIPLQLILLKEGETILEKRINSVDEIIVFQRDMDKMPTGEYQVILIDANDITTGTTFSVSGNTASENKTQDQPKTAQKTQQTKTPSKPKTSGNTAGKTSGGTKSTTTTSSSEDKPGGAATNSNPSESATSPNALEEPVAFKSMDRPPLYKRCAGKRRKKAIECTEETIRYTVERELERLREVQQKKIKGMLNVVFIIDEKGVVSVKSILPDWGNDFNAKVKKIVEDLPQFEPGQNALGMPVPVQYSLPIRFQ